MAGGIPDKEIVGKLEFAGGLNGSRIFYSVCGKSVYNTLIVGSEGIGHTAYGIFAKRLKTASVLKYLICHLLCGMSFKEGMGESVAGHLVTLVKLSNLG